MLSGVCHDAATTKLGKSHSPLSRLLPLLLVVAVVRTML